MSKLGDGVDRGEVSVITWLKDLEDRIEGLEAEKGQRVNDAEKRASHTVCREALQVANEARGALAIERDALRTERDGLRREVEKRSTVRIGAKAVIEALEELGRTISPETHLGLHWGRGSGIRCYSELQDLPEWGPPAFGQIIIERDCPLEYPPNGFLTSQVNALTRENDRLRDMLREVKVILS